MALCLQLAAPKAGALLAKMQNLWLGERADGGLCLWGCKFTQLESVLLLREGSVVSMAA